MFREPTVDLKNSSSKIILNDSSLSEFSSDKMDLESIKKFLESKGYFLLNKLGVGKTREAYLAVYNSGYTKNLRVVKIPLKNYDISSLCTIINMSKRDPDENEAKISNLLAHPNLITVLDNFQIDGLNLNVEEYFQQAQSLEETIKRTGHITNNEKFINIFSQVINGVEYANYRKTNNKYSWADAGILIRDIKPSNILVGEDGFVKITDLQNAAEIDKIVELSLPTRGGTAYTRPNLINTLVTGTPAKADRQTEVYSVAASMYYALTGHDAFKYNIKETTDGTGKKIVIGEEEHTIKLYINDEERESISKEEHERTLKTALKEVPQKYRKMLYRGLTLTDKAFNNVKELQPQFEKLKAPTKADFAKKIYSSIKPTLITLAVCGSIVGLTALMRYQDSRLPVKPTFAEMLRNDDYSHFSMKTWNNDVDSIYTMDVLKPYFNKISEELPRLFEEKDGDKTAELKYIKFAADDAGKINGIDERLMTSLIATCYLNGWEQEDVDELYTEDGKMGRLAPTYVPSGFVMRNDHYGDGRNLSDEAKAAYAAMYLKACIAGQGISGMSDSVPGGANVADVFASYFCTNEDINTARIRTKSLGYFPRVGDDHGLDIGYGQFIQYEKGDLVNTAVAIYLITDEEGNIDLKKIPELKGLYGQYKEILHLPEN